MPPIVIGTSLEPDWNLIGTSPWDKQEKYKRDSGLTFGINAEKASKTRVNEFLLASTFQRGHWSLTRPLLTIEEKTHLWTYIEQQDMATPHFVNRENMIADSEYIQWLSDVKKRFRQSQGRALVKVNAEMLDFYWGIGRDLVMLKAEARWGDGVVKQFAFDMREAFPEASGFSYSNVKYMKQWYLFYNQQLEKSQRPVGLFENKDEYSQLEKSQRPIGFLPMPEMFGRIPWGHHIDISLTTC